MSAKKSRLWAGFPTPRFEYHAGEVLLFPVYIFKAFVDEYREIKDQKEQT
jgi:hypothetical protein